MLKCTKTFTSVYLVTFALIFHPKIDPEVHENVYHRVFGDFWMDFAPARSQKRTEDGQEHRVVM